MSQTIATYVAKSSDRAAGRLAWQSLRTLGGAVNRAFSALVTFWNIPVLGEDETQESRYFRTRRYI